MQCRVKPLPKKFRFACCCTPPRSHSRRRHVEPLVRCPGVQSTAIRNPFSQSICKHGTAAVGLSRSVRETRCTRAGASSLQSSAGSSLWCRVWDGSSHKFLARGIPRLSPDMLTRLLRGCRFKRLVQDHHVTESFDESVIISIIIIVCLDTLSLSKGCFPVDMAMVEMAIRALKKKADVKERAPWFVYISCAARKPTAKSN